MFTARIILYDKDKWWIVVIWYVMYMYTHLLAVLMTRVSIL
jgi:hypothetical protein